MTKAIVVLADGETWTEVQGCSICIVEDSDIDRMMEEDMRPCDIIPIYEIGLDGYDYSKDTALP